MKEKIEGRVINIENITELAFPDGDPEGSAIYTIDAKFRHKQSNKMLSTTIAIDSSELKMFINKLPEIGSLVNITYKKKLFFFDSYILEHEFIEPTIANFHVQDIK